MIDLKVNEKKKFNFQLEISGVQAQDLKGSMKLIIEGVEYGFPVSLIDGSVVVEVPAIEKITKATLTEGQSLPVTLEIIANDTFIIPWKDSFTVRKPVKVEAKIVDIKDVLDEIDIKPKITITNIKEEKVEEKKKSVLGIGDNVKMLRGNYKGKIGKVIDFSLEDDQVDVKFSDGKTRHPGFDDIKIVEGKKADEDCGKDHDKKKKDKKKPTKMSEKVFGNL